MLEPKGKFFLIFLSTHLRFGIVITKILIINLEVFNPTCKPILSPDKVISICARAHACEHSWEEWGGTKKRRGKYQISHCQGTVTDLKGDTTYPYLPLKIQPHHRREAQPTEF